MVHRSHCTPLHGAHPPAILAALSLCSASRTCAVPLSWRWVKSSRFGTARSFGRHTVSLEKVGARGILCGPHGRPNSGKPSSLARPVEIDRGQGRRGHRAPGDNVAPGDPVKFTPHTQQFYGQTLFFSQRRCATLAQPVPSRTLVLRAGAQTKM